MLKKIKQLILIFFSFTLVNSQSKKVLTFKLEENSKLELKCDVKIVVMKNENSEKLEIKVININHEKDADYFQSNCEVEEELSAITSSLEKIKPFLRQQETIYLENMIDEIKEDNEDYEFLNIFYDKEFEILKCLAPLAEYVTKYNKEFFTIYL